MPETVTDFRNVVGFSFLKGGINKVKHRNVITRKEKFQVYDKLF